MSSFPSNQSRRFIVMVAMLPLLLVGVLLWQMQMPAEARTLTADTTQSTPLTIDDLDPVILQARSSSMGDPDITFGTGGTTVNDLSTGTTIATDSLMQSDGKIVVQTFAAHMGS